MDVTPISGDATRDPTAAQLLQFLSVAKGESARDAAFMRVMMQEQAKRSEANDVRKQMDEIFADILTVLKKTGEQVRQSS
ncbi:MAG: hypothetical protein MUE98_00940 [Rhodobacteraceae bacterium]|jgi:hypothetical protein|nr:hypothetical protein [Paracoccaceae bacterium]